MGSFSALMVWPTLVFMSMFMSKMEGFQPNSAESLKEHLAAWDSELDHCTIALIDLSKQFFDKTGLINCYVKKALCHVRKDREKIRRWYARFTESNWSAHDMHYVDDALHSKEKSKEGK